MRSLCVLGISFCLGTPLFGDTVSVRSIFSNYSNRILLSACFSNKGMITQDVVNAYVPKAENLQKFVKEVGRLPACLGIDIRGALVRCAHAWDAGDTEFRHTSGIVKHTGNDYYERFGEKDFFRKLTHAEHSKAKAYYDEVKAIPATFCVNTKQSVERYVQAIQDGHDDMREENGMLKYVVSPRYADVYPLSQKPFWEELRDDKRSNVIDYYKELKKLPQWLTENVDNALQKYVDGLDIWGGSRQKDANGLLKHVAYPAEYLEIMERAQDTTRIGGCINSDNAQKHLARPVNKLRWKQLQEDEQVTWADETGSTKKGYLNWNKWLRGMPEKDWVLYTDRAWVQHNDVDTSQKKETKLKELQQKFLAWHLPGFVSRDNIKKFFIAWSAYKGGINNAPSFKAQADFFLNQLHFLYEQGQANHDLQTRILSFMSEGGGACTDAAAVALDQLIALALTQNTNNQTDDTKEKACLGALLASAKKDSLMGAMQGVEAVEFYLKWARLLSPLTNMGFKINQQQYTQMGYGEMTGNTMPAVLSAVVPQRSTDAMVGHLMSHINWKDYVEKSDELQGVKKQYEDDGFVDENINEKMDNVHKNLLLRALHKHGFIEDTPLYGEIDWGVNPGPAATAPNPWAAPTRNLRTAAAQPAQRNHDAIDLFRNSRLEAPVVDSSDKVCTQSKPFASIAIPI